MICGDVGANSMIASWQRPRPAVISVRQIQDKYGLDEAQAQNNVDIWADGRVFEADRRSAGG